MTRRSPVTRCTRSLALVAVLALAAGLAACGSDSTASTTSSTTTAAASVTPAAKAAIANGATPSKTDAAGVEWLCMPGTPGDPCTGNLTATVVPASGPSTVQQASAATDPAVDCFYVYPTVSKQETVAANLAIDPAETDVARVQASRFSQVCRVYAPMYPQLTIHALTDPTASAIGDLGNAYQAVQSAWEDYLAHYNHGRGVIVIGHSQGAAMLIKLLQNVVDDDPAVRAKLVSAIILGGNVTVPVGQTVGGSFDHIPACATATQTGCVVAYSSFEQTPPADTYFGRPGSGVSLLSGSLASAGLQVLCVNPAAVTGGTASLQPYFSTASATAGLGTGSSSAAPVAATPWYTEPDLYSAHCMSQNGTTWLQVSAPIQPGDPRPVVSQTLGPAWGLHLVDVNIALGNLVDLARSQAAAYRG